MQFAVYFSHCIIGENFSVFQEWENAQQATTTDVRIQAMDRSREHFTGILHFQERLDKAEAAIASATETLQQVRLRTLVVAFGNAR